MEVPMLNDIMIIFGLSIVVLYIFHRLKIPVIVGFLLTGILAGPHGLALVKGVHEVEFLAEIGVVLLLFTIGIEFSFQTLSQIRRSVLMGGSLQVFITIALSWLIAWKSGLPFGEALFIGFLVSLSSTAIVLKLIQERAEVDSPHGRSVLGILIFQDIIIVPMMLVTPILAGAEGNLAYTLLFLIAKGIAVIALVFLSAKWIVPQLLYRVAKTRNSELFLLSIVVICLVVAWLTSSIGLSLALGAFLAGLIISESDYSHQALGNILPFRDVFTSFFFVSIGMLLDISIIIREPWIILLLTIGVIIFKAVIAGAAAAIMGYPVRTTVLIGLALSQVGEFSFILSRTGVEHGILAGDVYQLFLAVSVLTMAATPFIIALAPRMAEFASNLPLPAKLKFGYYRLEEAASSDIKDHLIIVGFGLNGKNVARAASVTDIPYVIIEMNTDTVKEEMEKGEPIYFGDASQEAVLNHLGIKDSRVVVIAISDPGATRRIVELVKRLNPRVYLIVRTRYVEALESLYDLGADEVIPEEFETSVEIFTRVLKKYLIPRGEIDKFISEIRSDGYEMFRTVPRKKTSFSDIKVHLPEIELNTIRVSDKAPVVGKSLEQIELRKKYGVTMMAIRRNTEILYNPHGSMEICPNDLVIITGQREKMIKIAYLFNDPEEIATQ